MQGASVAIDFLPASAERYRATHAIVAIDVIRATTTLATAAHAGRRCLVATSVEAALERAAQLERPLLVGELAGNMPFGFDLTNSPAALEGRADVQRPMVLVSSSGTQLIHNARGCEALYIACLRNYRATARHVCGRHRRVAVLGAGTRGEFREEDQLCCAWIAALLIDWGYAPENDTTSRLAEHWRNASAEDCRVSKSVSYLISTEQYGDLDFVFSHVDDLDAVFRCEGDEVRPVGRDAAGQGTPSLQALAIPRSPAAV